MNLSATSTKMEIYLKRNSVSFKCEYCGGPGSDRASHFKRKRRHFCKQECYSRFRAELLPKEEQHAYKGGGMCAEDRRLRARARSVLNHAIRDGKLKRLPCRDCGDAKTEAHHSDYGKPLDVIWLCDMHHHRIHENPELLKSDGAGKGEGE